VRKKRTGGKSRQVRSVLAYRVQGQALPSRCLFRGDLKASVPRRVLLCRSGFPGFQTEFSGERVKVSPDKEGAVRCNDGASNKTERNKKGKAA